jgi:peptidoglycan/xylan/chitin deacetylase (PgdA/CDA1 family)
MGIGTLALSKILLRTAARAVGAVPVLAIILGMGRGNVPFEKALLTFRFDDAYQTQLQAMELLGSRSIRATLYSITGYIETPSYMTWKDLGRLNSLGHEIGSHSVNHGSMLLSTRASLEKQFRESRDSLEKNGIVAKSFAWPYGLRSLFHDRVVKKYFASAVSYPLLNGGAMNFKNANPYDIKCVVVHTVDEFDDVIKKAVETGAWLVVCFHRIDGNGRFSTGMKEFEGMVKLAADYREKGLVDIVTVTEGVGRLEGRK